MKTFVICLVWLTLLGNMLLAADEPTAVLTQTEKVPAKVESTADRDARMKWWREARFGMFVHWGLYSGLAGTWNGKPVGKKGGMEWLQKRVGADTDTYAEKAIPLFKPSEDFAQQWAKLAKEAGCEYVVFTTKHHDGFALHDSKVTDFDAGSVLQRDLVKEIVTALRAEGLRVGFYHSVIDWHHDQYAYANSKQLPHPLRGKPYPNGERDHSQYIDFLHQQTHELFSSYGQIDVVWWDYSSVDFQGEKAWRAFDLIKQTRELQPNILMNNRLFRLPKAGFSGMGTHAISEKMDSRYGDFSTPEQHVPPNGIPGVDWESCMTMNTTWGYSDHDHKWKTNQKLIRTLIDVASKGGNYLLNIGPYGDGTVPSQSVSSMGAIGKWMKVNGDSIRATTASPLPKLDWGRCTTGATVDGKKRLYLHVFKWPSNGSLSVPLKAANNPQASLLATGEKLECDAGADSLTIKLSSYALDKVATVIQLDLDQ